MMRPLSLRWLVPLALVVLLLPACSDSGDEAADTTLAPTSTTEAMTTTAAPTTTVPATTPTSTTLAESSVALPGPGEAWDMLVFSVEYVFGEEFLAMYEQEAEAALGVEVNAAYAAGIDETAWKILQHLRDEAYPPLGDLVREAEIIVMLAYPEESYDGDTGAIDVDGKNCRYEASTQTPEPPAPTTDEYWAPYATLLDDIYNEIWTLRENTPTVLIGPDLQNREIARQRRGDVEAECREWTEAWSAVVREAAERNGAVYVALSDVMTGPGHDIDSFEAGYTGATDQYPTIWYGQPNEIGTPMVVEAITAAGFEPTTQP